MKVEEYISTFNTATIKMTIAENNDAERNEELVNLRPRKRVYISDITLSVTSTLNTAYTVKKPVTLQ